MVQIILHNDLLSLIHSYLTFVDKLNHRNTCKQFRLIRITDLYNIDPKRSSALDDWNFMQICGYDTITIIL